MGEKKIEEFKLIVKREFRHRKKTEEGLKLMHVYNDMSRYAGYRNWNTYSAILKAANDLEPLPFLKAAKD
jgi:hypothetical protein